jgi:hypothetical protein
MQEGAVDNGRNILRSFLFLASYPEVRKFLAQYVDGEGGGGGLWIDALAWVVNPSLLKLVRDVLLKASLCCTTTTDVR